MAKDLFHRYVWLLDTINFRPNISFDEVNNLWKDSSLNDSGKDLPLRTFHNHRYAIRNEFSVDIACDRKTNLYYIDNFSDFVEIQKKDINQKNSATRFNPKNSFDNTFFSKSEIEILENVAKKYKTYTKEQISEESHSLKEYINTDMNDFINISDMTENKELKEYLNFWKNEHKEFNKMLNN